MTGQPAPAYSATLIAYRRAFHRELCRAMDAVPLTAGCRLLDVPCGDGFYAAYFATRLDSSGSVTAADNSPAYLGYARRLVSRLGVVARTEFVEADVYQMPFEDNAFDVVWCARSLISLKDPVAALREMKRVVRRGGLVAVLEDDEFHQVVLNSSVILELELHRAIAEMARVKYGSAAGLSPARSVYHHLQQAGLELESRQTFAADRNAPFDITVQRYLKLYFSDLRKSIEGFLSPQIAAAWDREISSSHDGSWFARPDAELTCLTTLFLSRKCD